MTIQEQLPDAAAAPAAATTADAPVLACSNGTCSVPNLVTLAQGDPLIPQTDPHPDMPSQMAFGCYNSAIVMVANAALANRRSGLAPAGGRTKEFDAIRASVNGAGKAVPKAVNQLIWQYHRQIEDSAGTGRVYYLHEMVADLAGGKILQSHDPRNYGSCWGPGTNAAGAAFRDGLWDWAHVDDEYVRTLLNDGIVPLLAFGRYTPVAKWNPATSRYDVTLTKAPANQHKVVFSGYTAGAKYGLDIHDPGSGGTANVRLVQGGPELRRAARGFGEAAATGALLGKLTWRNHDTAGGTVQTVPPPSGTFLEYESTIRPGDPVLVLEHIDGASLNWKGGERVWSGRWGPWTNLTTFVKDGTEYLLTYNRPTGAVMFSRFWGSLHGVETVWEGTWGPWTHFVPFEWNGTAHLLTYDRDSRAAMISRFWPGLNGVETVWQGTFGPWTNLAVFQRDGQPFLLTYDRASQKAMTSRFFGGLNGVDTIWEGTWGPWTHLVPMSAPDRTHLVAYDAATGVLQTSQFFPGLTGTHTTHQETIATGCDVAAVRAPGLPHFTVHHHKIDLRTLYRISPDGVDTVARLGTQGGTKGASIDVPFRLGGRAYQVNYHPATGDVDFTRWRTL